MRLLQVFVTLTAAVGTAIQLRLSLIDFGRSRKEAVEWWTAEDDLVAEAPRLRRRRMRRELRSWRDPEIHRTIRDLHLAVGSWTLLVVAAVLATYASVIELLN
ncbi:hypothetical protein EFK50_20370 [Nocardioides marmoriginsengisoli]|uniref:Uncharacterized protein n=1 Tax=Nocardioides marmoriginsengisoli TaxID=661483 RepID=A0A3N0CB33_9ACTN|nr:hypothetical protein [Nocardioides marmoriginsengisoli]RNL60667.1 hypothetical protein EFK50_20370 [Nocardioides marmoriginsengisoli]